MEEIFEIRDDEINVEEIMRKIKENIARRKMLGEGREEVKIPPKGDSDFLQNILNDLDFINNNWNVENESYAIFSHRRVLGPFLVRGRKLVHGEVRRYVDPIFWKQREFNASVVRILNETAKKVDEVSSKANEMNKVLEELKKQISELESRINTLKTSDVDEHEAEHYYLFEEKFRGSRDIIKERFKKYMRYFEGCKNVLDIGCGRGEFLELARERGIGAKGVDVNEDMVKYCQSRGLDVVKADAIEYLESLEDKSLDGVFMAQVVEHLEPKYLVNLLKLCYRKLKFGYYIVIETVNPLSLSSLMNFYADLTHKKPVHPDTLKFLLEYVGFRDIEIRFHEELSSNIKLAKIENESFGEELQVFVEVYNQNIEKLNSILFGAQDYAIVGRK